MLSKFDDYPVHQAPCPIAEPATTDKNFYDRYWFNGFQKGGDFSFAAALGVYPNRSVMDGSFTVVAGGVQHSFHASRLNPSQRNETILGPFRVEVISPMRVLRLHLEENETGIMCDLTFTARTAAIEEPRSVMRRNNVVIMDTTRFAQFGRWQGWIKAEGSHIEVNTEDVYGVRDRSWGIRPVGERDAGYGSDQIPQVFWLWAPVHFDDCCTHFGIFEDAEGNQTQGSGMIITAWNKLEDVPFQGDLGIKDMPSVTQRITWRKGLRQVEKAAVELVSADGEKSIISLEPLSRIHLRGIGYAHEEWGHGMWKGEFAMAGEHWAMDEVDPNDYRFQHQQHICRATMGNRVGTGVLEQLCFGAHKPSGFTGFMEVEET